MDVSVCIVSWNTKELLYKCIKSIKDKTFGISYEIIVVDNASTDGSSEMILEKFSDCKLIESKNNLGFAKGNNVAVKEALGKYILYLNPDTEVVTNAIHGMFHFLKTNKEYGAVGCKLTDVKGNIQHTCASTFPTPLTELSLLFLLNRIFPRSKYFSTRELDYWDHVDSRDVDCLSGACIMARRDLIERMKGFDEKIFMYSEDLDMCYRILKEGFKIYYLSTEVIKHLAGASSRKAKNVHFAVLMQKQSNYYFMRKHYGGFHAQCFRMAIFAGSLFRILIAIFLLLAFSCGLVKKDINPRYILGKYTNMLLWSLHIKRDPRFEQSCCSLNRKII